MFEFILVAESLGVINDYFEKEACEEDFWPLPEGSNEFFEEKERDLWLMVNSKKIKEKFRTRSEILILSPHEKESLLKAFILLRKYSEDLPDNAHLNERLLVAKKRLPPVFFNRKTVERGCKIISLFKK